MKIFTAYYFAIAIASSGFWLWFILISGSPDLIDALIWWLSNGGLK